MIDTMHQHQQGSGEVDALTGLPAFDAFLATLETAVAAADEAGGSASMGLVDIDFFDKLNKEHGHDAGDGVLKAVSAFLRKRFDGDGAVFRYGGDAFAAVFAGIEKEEAFLMLEQARKDFNGEHSVEAGDKKITLKIAVSAGLAACPDDGSSAQQVVRKANEALYRSKVSGRSKVCLAREEKMVTKTSHYTQGQLQGLSRLAKRMGLGEAELLREGLDDLLRKYNS